MLITARNIACDASDRNVLSSPSRELFWRGFVYKGGRRGGAESLRELLETDEREIPRFAAKLKGIYFIALHCKPSGNIYAFVDQAGLYHAYYSSRHICSSFLDLVRAEHCTHNDIDPEALVEFFHFGCIYEDRTFFPSIRKINPDAIIRCGPNGATTVLRRPVPDIAKSPQRPFDAVLRDFATAAMDEHVSMDITGGADSRLLASALAYFGLPFETATSGRPGIPDLEIGASVAKVLGRPFYPTYHSASRCDWDEIFDLSDAMVDVTKNNRQLQLQRDRRKRGITLSVSGAAGEAFRETWWMHDFPFYTRRVAKLERLYALRIAPRPLQHSLLDGNYEKCSEHQRDNFLRRVSRYAVPGNTRTYDRIYYYLQLRAWSGTFVTSSIRLLKVGIPYADREMMRIGYNLPRTQRILSRFHRKMIAKYSRAAAELPTTESGVSLASGTLAFSLDLSRYLADRSKRLTKKIGQQLLGRTFFQDSSDDPRMFDQLSGAITSHKSTEVLADYGVFRRSVDPSTLPKRYLGTVFVLGKLFEEIGGSKTQKNPASDLPQTESHGHRVHGTACCTRIPT